MAEGTTSPLVAPSDTDALLKDFGDRLKALEQTAIMPVGIILHVPGAIPNGWLLCDGSTISAQRYGQLVAYLGSTTLPAIIGRVIVSRGGTFLTTGALGGLENVTLTAAQSGLPGHTHTYNRPSTINLTAGALTVNAGNLVADTTGATGGSSAAASHTNMPPYIVLIPIIKY